LDSNEVIDHILRKPLDNQQNWVKRVFLKISRLSFSIHPRMLWRQALSEFTDKELTRSQCACPSADHINDFFTVLRTELLFISKLKT
jgi:hypothetical protein